MFLTCAALPQRHLKAARRREIDVIIVWRLDRWGRSLADLVVTLKELTLDVVTRLQINHQVRRDNVKLAIQIEESRQGMRAYTAFGASLACWTSPLVREGLRDFHRNRERVRI